MMQAIEIPRDFKVTCNFCALQMSTKFGYALLNLVIYLRTYLFRLEQWQSGCYAPGLKSGSLDVMNPSTDVLLDRARQ